MGNSTCVEYIGERAKLLTGPVAKDGGARCVLYGYTLIKPSTRCSDERVRHIGLPSYSKLPENLSNAGAKRMRARVTQRGRAG